MFSLPRLSFKSSRQGFTLIELMIAISIIAILATVGMLVYTNGQRLARDARRKADLKQIKNSLFLYYNDMKAFPSATSWVYSGAGGTWIGGLGVNYIDAIPVDPLNTCASGTVQDTASCFRYGYFTLSAASPCPAADQHFVLAASLENASDPEANSDQSYTLCNGATFTNPNLYIIANNR